MNVLCVDFDHSDATVHPILKRLMRSENTRVVVAEYFYPELAESLSRFAMAFANGKKTGGAFRKRIQYACKLAEVCADAHKTVAVADIAYKAGYMLNRTALRSALAIPALFPSLPIGMWLFLANTAWRINLIRQYHKGEGIFDVNKINSLDRYVVDFEQARRLYAAGGLHLLTRQYPPQNTPGREHPLIIVNYPKAHGMRILDALVQRQPALTHTKNIIYRMFGFNLDFSLRTWEYKGSVLDGTTKHPTPYKTSDGDQPAGLSRWWRISHQPIPLP